MRKIAFIPARSGSKRFPNKNIFPLCGKPLFVWTVESFIKSNCFDEIIFSSDSDEYNNILKQYVKTDIIKFHKRSKEEAGDKIKIFDYIKKNISNFCNDEDLFAMGLPTCPLRRDFHIKDCIELYLSKRKSVFSACEFDFHVSFAFKLNKYDNENFWEPAFKNSPMITGQTRSQDQEKFFHPNGAIYIIKPEELKNNLKTFYINSIPYIMNKKYSTDIDNKIDLEIAEISINQGILDKE